MLGLISYTLSTNDKARRPQRIFGFKVSKGCQKSRMSCSACMVTQNLIILTIICNRLRFVKCCTQKLHEMEAKQGDHVCAPPHQP